MTAPQRALAAGAGWRAAGFLPYSFAASETPAPPAPQTQADPFAFVRSMEGTRPDGQVAQDPGGELVVDAELGHLFDYYLAGLGEKDLAAITMQIERELDARLGKRAA